MTLPIVSDTVKSVPRKRHELSPKLEQELAKLRERKDRAQAQADALDAQLRRRMAEISEAGEAGMQAIADAVGVTKAWVHLVVKDHRQKQAQAAAEPCAVARCPKPGTQHRTVNDLELDVCEDHAKLLPKG